jgi:hypothetical protein
MGSHRADERIRSRNVLVMLCPVDAPMARECISTRIAAGRACGVAAGLAQASDAG